jgi:hypothetical protein
MRRATLGLATALTILAAPVFAQAVKQMGEYRSWTAYAATDTTGPVCFAISKPVSVEPMPDGYTEASLYLTNRPSEGVADELNLIAGYMFAPDTPAIALVDGQTFELFTEKDGAWLRNASEATNLASALRAGTTLVIEGTSDKGIKITETFSLSGATAASRAISDNCTG